MRFKKSTFGVQKVHFLGVLHPLKKKKKKKKNMILATGLHMIAQKHPNFGNWAHDYFIKLGYFKVVCGWEKNNSQFAGVWHSEVFATLL